MSSEKWASYSLKAGVVFLVLSFILGFIVIWVPMLFPCNPINYTGGCYIIDLLSILVFFAILLTGLTFGIFKLIMLYHSAFVSKKILWALFILFFPLVEFLYYYNHIYSKKRKNGKKG